MSAGEKTRRHILDAALSVIDAEGVDAVTHRRVGREAGLSHGVVGYHFPTRDGLIQKAFEHHLGSIETYGEKIGLPGVERLTRDSIIDILANLVAVELTQGVSIRIDLELALYGTRRPQLAALFNAWVEDGIGSLAASLERSGFGQPERLARALINLTRGFLLDRLSDASLTEGEFRARAETLLASMAPKASHLARQTQ